LPNIQYLHEHNANVGTLLQIFICSLIVKSSQNNYVQY
jgi:hypothetical protein